MAHYSYRDSFIEAIIKDSEPFCLSKTDALGLDKAYMDETQRVEDNFPKVVNSFFTDPTEKIMTITTFKNNIVSEEYLSNHQSMDSGLKHIINTILRKSKIHLLSSQEEEKEWRKALSESYNGAVREGLTQSPRRAALLNMTSL